jgi:hypothetical protein
MRRHNKFVIVDNPESPPLEGPTIVNLMAQQLNELFNSRLNNESGNIFWLFGKENMPRLPKPPPVRIQPPWNAGILYDQSSPMMPLSPKPAWPRFILSRHSSKQARGHSRCTVCIQYRGWNHRPTPRWNFARSASSHYTLQS